MNKILFDVVDNIINIIIKNVNVITAKLIEYNIWVKYFIKLHFISRIPNRFKEKIEIDNIKQLISRQYIFA